MDLIHVAILAVVEGITEFLPISSTFHLILASRLLNIPQSEFLKLFEVFIQSGAILSVVFLYWRTLVTETKLMIQVAVSFIPTAIIGLILYKVIKGVFFELPQLMTLVFLLVGPLFLFVEYLVKAGKIHLKKSVSALTVNQALIIGVVQAFAVVPGVSRAGAVIIAMMLLQYRRDEAAKYSFLLSIPTIFAASVLDVFQMRAILMGNPQYISTLLIGFILTFASSYVFVKWLISYLKDNTLNIFAWYRIAVVILLIMASVAGVFKFV